MARNSTMTSQVSSPAVSDRAIRPEAFPAATVRRNMGRSSARTAPPSQMVLPDRAGTARGQCLAWRSPRARSSMNWLPLWSPIILTFCTISSVEASSSTCSLTNHWRKIVVA